MTAMRAPQLLTVVAAAERLSCSVNHIYRLIASGQLATVEIKQATSKRAKTRVREGDLADFIDANTTTFDGEVTHIR